MTKDNQGFPLDVTVPAAEWGMLKRRAAFLEAALIQVLRDGEAIKEWFSVADLAALRLPGIPTARNAITRAARDQGWMAREVPGPGGAKLVYHFSSLPRRAFEELIDRVVRHPPPGSEHVAPAHQVAAARPKAAPAASPADGAEPPWLLPLVRIIRRGGADVETALDELPEVLPAGIPCPTREEALAALSRLGLAG